MQALNKDSDFDEITKAHFSAPSSQVVDMMNCEASSRDSFFNRIFNNPDKSKVKKKNKKEKKGFFNKIFGKKKRD